MKSIYLSILACLFGFAGCESEKKAQKVLPKADMVRVLTEIYLAEEKVQRVGLKVDSSARLFSRMNEKIEQRTGISDSVFQESLRYYMERPKEMQEIYTVLVDSLNLMEQRSSFGTEGQ